ncbi:hypothetical protein CI102_311 [Trichoderma harzianum]|nr:hypothetical protein CI102_311 [Trichoderma harzianum]
MSYAYGYAVNDIIAVLGLFERIAIELRNFKNAPAHFQQLGAEVDLLQNAMRHALRLIPQNDAHRDTLERVRAIVMHCLTPLQALVHKMRTKESSLGHFRTSKSLSHIGTRIHWSMIAKQDIDEVRITITSETVAINMLLIAQSLYESLIKTHSDALIKQTSSILSLVSTMPDTIADLKLTTIMNDKKQSEQARMLEHGLAAVASHVGSLSQIGVKVSGALSLHTASMRRSVRRLLSLMRDIKELFVLRALLNIASQMKRIIRAIEAIPLHLTLDIVRLDDALGESWALPIQACQSWKSFYNLLSTVVYTKDRPGSNRIWTMQFALTMADGGTELEEFNWERVIKPGIHIEQAMIVTRVGASTEACHECSPELPSMRIDEELHHFRRIQIRESSGPIHDIDTAEAILRTDFMDPVANTFLALRLIQLAEEDGDPEALEMAIEYLEDAISSAEFRNSLDAIVQAIRLNPYFYMSWYNLGILYDACDQTEDAYLSFERCLQLNPDLPDVQARLDVLAGFRNGEKNIPDDYKIYDMLQCELMAMVDLSDNIDGAEIVFNPIIEAENNE